MYLCMYILIHDYVCRYHIHQCMRESLTSCYHRAQGGHLLIQIRVNNLNLEGYYVHDILLAILRCNGSAVIVIEDGVVLASYTHAAVKKAIR